MRLLTTVLCTTVLAGAALSAQMPARPASPPGAAEIEVGGKWETEKAPNGRERQVYKGGKWVVDQLRPAAEARARAVRHRRRLRDEAERRGARVARRRRRVDAAQDRSAARHRRQDAAARRVHDVHRSQAGRWTLIVSTHKAQEKYDPNNKEAIWGAYGYDAKNDVVRVPMQIADDPVLARSSSPGASPT